MKKVMKVIAAGIVCTCIFCFGKAIRDKTAKVYQQFCEETEPEEWIDFNYWQNRNADVYAWIRIPGTKIDYPVVQGDEDGYYLSHDIDKESNIYGAIYTETANDIDFSDGNTVIYGHNTLDRFEKLHEYQDRTFFDENREVRIYLPEKMLVYRIFAAYPYDDRHLIAAYDFSDPIIFRNYLEEVFSIRQIDAFIDDTMDVTEDDKLITLETGVSGEPDQRYLVQAVLVEGQ